MGVAVVTDSTQYLPAEVVAANRLHVVPLYVNFGGIVARESDMPDLQDFYARLRAAAAHMPTTSQPSIGDFLATYEPLLQAGEDIVSIHLSAGLSGTFESAMQARDQLVEDGYAGRVEVLDSRTVCGGLGLVLLAAAARARAGGGLAEVARHALEARAGVRIWFSVDTLEYLRRGGRIGGAQAWLGGALKIKPILSLESEILPVERVRTSRRAFERMVVYARELHDGGADAWCVQHIQAPDEAQRLVDRAGEIFGCDPLFVGEVGPVIGVHAGPGMLGIGAMPQSMLP
jgi:DegV family protein with EDD domain